jgi:hypothetical protein
VYFYGLLDKMKKMLNNVMNFYQINKSIKKLIKELFVDFSMIKLLLN